MNKCASPAGAKYAAHPKQGETSMPNPNLKPYRRMSFCAPRRPDINGGVWTAELVREYLSIGGWFKKSYHYFDSRDTAKLAGCGSEE